MVLVELLPTLIMPIYDSSILSSRVPSSSFFFSLSLFFSLLQKTKSSKTCAPLIIPFFLPFSFLSGLGLKNVFKTREEFTALIKEHYKYQVLSQVRIVLR